ncbi:hypothetical protein ACFW4O_26560 [Streptomyces mutabilis]|uniref:hypothetical protein n=1 Tax=Streptomyces mutabilis TaxID=67332 RepID=UPI0015CDACA0|nr:hypothetical protein [Streptomyces sp. alain-838]
MMTLACPRTVPAWTGTARTGAGLPLEGRHHRGVDDAWNIAALVLGLAERGSWPAP